MKLQSAIEMLVVYSWALIIIALVLAALLYIAFSKPPQQYLGADCNISPALPCSASAVYAYSGSQPITFYMIFVNQLGSPIAFTTNPIRYTVSGLGSTNQNTYTGSCNPSISLPGSQVTCVVTISGTYEPSVGSVITDQFTLNYIICNNSVPITCAGSTYPTTGDSTQTFSNAKFTVYTVNMITKQGNIVLNGMEYANSVNVILPAGNYVVYASPQSNYSFYSWNIITTGTTSLNSLTSQMTTLNLRSNAILTSNYISG